MRLLLLILLLVIGNLGAEYDVILVRGDIYADWIIAQAYSHKSNVPIIATSPENLDQQIREQLQGYRGFGFDRVLIIGGERAVSPEVQRDIEDMGYGTHRISEADRSGTSSRVAVELFSGSDTVILANGGTSEALLVAGRLASATGNPVLFVREDEIPPSVSMALDSIGVRNVILVDLDLSDGVKSQLVSQGFDLEILISSEDYREKQSSGIPRVVLFVALGVAIGVISVFLMDKLLVKKESVPITVLTEDEKRVVTAINEHGGEITQDQLPDLTSFSRPKISRVVSELVDRGVISKEPLGRTQRILMKKKLTKES